MRSPALKFSVVIPAHNEERCLPSCLDSVERASAACDGRVETIVVLNRCTDATGAIARDRQARVVDQDGKNLARVRNAGSREAEGEILVTIDADSVMSANMLTQVERALSSGRYIGGGVPIRPERWSLGILMAGLILAVFLAPKGISGGLFWCYRRDFESIGGFDERFSSGEDVDFACRLKSYGRERNKKYGTLWRTCITSSCRKFDQFGDWFVVGLACRHPVRFWHALHGRDRELADRYWYDVGR
ncbi:glycosyltransferase [Verrucomicrobiota bacterium]